VGQGGQHQTVVIDHQDLAPAYACFLRNRHLINLPF
jgi:hypothetical protein